MANYFQTARLRKTSVKDNSFFVTLTLLAPGLLRALTRPHKHWPPTLPALNWKIPPLFCSTNSCSVLKWFWMHNHPKNSTMNKEWSCFWKLFFPNLNGFFYEEQQRKKALTHQPKSPLAPQHERPWSHWEIITLSHSVRHFTWNTLLECSIACISAQEIQSKQQSHLGLLKWEPLSPLSIYEGAQLLTCK